MIWRPTKTERIDARRRASSVPSCLSAMLRKVAGSYAMQIDDNRRMRKALVAKGYPLHYSEYDGGHAFLNWSGGMADGLQFLLAK